MKFVVVGMDGMRPDMVGPELTPNLHEFSKDYCEFSQHCCTFPSETYVNTASMLTGSHPETHGLVANVFCQSPDGRSPWFKGFEVESIERLNEATGGGLMMSPSAGEILGQAGMHMAVICTNSAGSVRLMHHQIGKYGHLSLCPHSIDTSSPQELVQEIIERFPPLPEKVIPDLAGVTYATDVFLDYLAPRGLPELSLLWYGEPDNTYHINGIGSPENLEALRHTDAQLGRVLEWWQQKGRAQGVQLLIASDHGHLTITERISVSDYLGNAGFRLGEQLTDGVQVALLEGYCTNLLVKDGDAGLLKAVTQALVEADWLGSLFVGGGQAGADELPGVFPLSLVRAANHRSPHLAWTFKTSETANQHGYAGSCPHSIPLPIGGSIHGGLHAREMRCLLLAGGDYFKPGCRVDNPSCISDILPTILQGLGLQAPSGMTGRVLTEALSSSSWQPRVETEELSCGSGGYEQYLKRVRVDGRIYLAEGGRRE